jgi:hypothetical protein
MAKKKGGWINTCERFVAFLDIMGFRDRVFRESHKDVKKMLESLHPTIEHIEHFTNYILKENKNIKNVDKATPVIIPVSFSDSIILVSSDNSAGSATRIFSRTNWIVSKAIELGIPIKGAIAYGEMTADLEKSLYFGRPIIDAYELQNELQFYGVILHHTVEKCLFELKIINNLENMYFIHSFPVSLKSGKIIHYVVNWTREFKENKKASKVVSDLYYNVSGTPRLYVDNTIEFVRWIEKREAEMIEKEKEEEKKKH